MNNPRAQRSTTAGNNAPSQPCSRQAAVQRALQALRQARTLGGPPRPRQTGAGCPFERSAMHCPSATLRGAHAARRHCWTREHGSSPAALLAVQLCRSLLQAAAHQLPPTASQEGLEKSEADVAWAGRLWPCTGHAAPALRSYRITSFLAAPCGPHQLCRYSVLTLARVLAVLPFRVRSAPLATSTVLTCCVPPSSPPRKLRPGVRRAAARPQDSSRHARHPTRRCCVLRSLRCVLSLALFQLRL